LRSVEGSSSAFLSAFESIEYYMVLDRHTHNTFTGITFFLTFSFSVSSQCAGSEVKPLTGDRGCDSVLLGQSNRTPHGAVIDEYGANGGMIFCRGNRSTRRKPAQCHFVHHKSHMD
jgi:hypothetical protein